MATRTNIDEQPEMGDVPTQQTEATNDMEATPSLPSVDSELDTVSVCLCAQLIVCHIVLLLSSQVNVWLTGGERTERCRLGAGGHECGVSLLILGSDDFSRPWLT